MSGRGADPRPIQPELRELMNAVAGGLDEVFNGKDCAPADKKVGFFLVAFGFEKEGERIPGSRFNYISNADKLDVRVLLKDVLARLEARIQEGGRA